MAKSLFIRAMHPKTEIRPDRAAIERVLQAGWVGQMKIHGHRAQIHVSADSGEDPIAYNRQGKAHTKLLPPEIVAELRRLFQPDREWNVIDAEWLKSENRLFVFDLLKLEGQVLSQLTYPERYKLLPTDFISPCIQVLPVYRSVDKCLEVLARPETYIEGLVFKSQTTPGFADTSIVRCRRQISKS